MRAVSLLLLAAPFVAQAFTHSPTPLSREHHSKKGLLGLLGLLGLIPLLLLLSLSSLCLLCFLRRKKTAAAVPFATFDPCPPAVAAAPIPITQHIDLIPAPLTHHHIDIIPDHHHHIDVIPDHLHHVDVIPEHLHHF